MSYELAEFKREVNKFRQRSKGLGKKCFTLGSVCGDTRVAVFALYKGSEFYSYVPDPNFLGEIPIYMSIPQSLNETPADFITKAELQRQQNPNNQALPNLTVAVPPLTQEISSPPHAYTSPQVSPHVLRPRGDRVAKPKTPRLNRFKRGDGRQTRAYFTRGGEKD